MSAFAGLIILALFIFIAPAEVTPLAIIAIINITTSDKIVKISFRFI